MPDERFELARFLNAQEHDRTYDTALRELRAGRKREHWIWFVFPQVAGLGSSPMSERFAIRSLDEAVAYLEHPTLGARLVECAQALLDLEADDPVRVMGYIDAIKLRSSMTLFTKVAGADTVFARVLERYYAGEMDPATLSSQYAQ